MLTLLAALAHPSATGACTVFSRASEQGIIFAGNEDGTDPEARIWFEPATETGHGAIFLGFQDGFRQAGMNDAGLCFDITACPRMALETSPDRSDPAGNLTLRAMADCATVEQVVALFAAHNLKGFKGVQVMFADAQGRSVVLDCNHITLGEGGRQLVTNFYLSAPELGRHPCPRFTIGRELLEEAAPTVDDARRLLSAVRQEHRTQTQYSHICQPALGRMTLYRFHDFENPVVLELARGLAAAVDQYHATSMNHSEILNELASLGFQLQGNGQHAEAATVFRLMTEDFPTFARGFQWLGNALVGLEDLEAAATAYRQCLALDPNNGWARDTLVQIEEQG